MTPAEVPAELVEKAVPEVLALFEVCALDSTEEPNAACVYCRDDAEALTRAALVAVVREVESLHRRDTWSDCGRCHVAWPCPTAAAVQKLGGGS